MCKEILQSCPKSGKSGDPLVLLRRRHIQKIPARALCLFRLRFCICQRSLRLCHQLRESARILHCHIRHSFSEPNFSLAISATADREARRFTSFKKRPGKFSLVDASIARCISP
jgi:hypothetical protein